MSCFIGATPFSRGSSLSNFVTLNKFLRIFAYGRLGKFVHPWVCGLNDEIAENSGGACSVGTHVAMIRLRLLGLYNNNFCCSDLWLYFSKKCFEQIRAVKHLLFI
jgi:hypothetical protein